MAPYGVPNFFTFRGFLYLVVWILDSAVVFIRTELENTLVNWIVGCVIN